MPQVTGIGTTWNLPNYHGELFTADPTQTPLLSMSGGLTGGKQTNNFEFPTAVLYDFFVGGVLETKDKKRTDRLKALGHTVTEIKEQGGDSDAGTG